MNMNPRINLIQENYEKIVSFFSQKLSFIKFLKIYQIPWPRTFNQKSFCKAPIYLISFKRVIHLYIFQKNNDKNSQFLDSH